MRDAAAGELGGWRDDTCPCLERHGEEEKGEREGEGEEEEEDEEEEENRRVGERVV